MQPNLAAFVGFCLLLLVALIRWHSSAPIAESPSAGQWPQPRNPREGQQPEPVPARVRSWPSGLTLAVAVLAVVRVALFVTLRS